MIKSSQGRYFRCDRGCVRNRVSLIKSGGSSHNDSRNPVSCLVGYGGDRTIFPAAKKIILLTEGQAIAPDKCYRICRCTASVNFRLRSRIYLLPIAVPRMGIAIAWRRGTAELNCRVRSHSYLMPYTYRPTWYC